ncbi:hypothetical protein [Nostoc sp.]|uniref:hypothetical protein n=1 Tax=Nostoc sp. TaxID=1180 RepID=UPI002FF4FB5E
MILETHRLLMRDFIEADWQAVFAYQFDPLYLRYNDWTHRTQKDVCEFIQMFIDQQKEQPPTKFQLAVATDLANAWGYAEAYPDEIELAIERNEVA